MDANILQEIYEEIQENAAFLTEEVDWGVRLALRRVLLRSQIIEVAGEE